MGFRGSGLGVRVLRPILHPKSAKPEPPLPDALQPKHIALQPLQLLSVYGPERPRPLLQKMGGGGFPKRGVPLFGIPYGVSILVRGIPGVLLIMLGKCPKP